MEENTEDNHTLEDLYKSLAEVQTTNRFILRRLNQLVDSGTSGTCCCSRTKYDGESQEVDCHSNSGTSNSAGREYSAIVLQNDATEQQVKHHVMSETASKLQGSSIKYKGSATELSKTDVNRSITDAELITVDTSIFIYGLSSLAKATNTATVEQKDVSEQKTKPTKDESGDRSTHTVNIQLNDTGKRKKSIHPDNVTSNLEHAFSIQSTDSGKVNENEIKIKPVTCTSKDKKESSIKIKKPNFSRDRSSMNERDMPVVIEQNQKKFYEDHKFWDELAHEELHEALKNSGVMDTDGAHTVLCIDISLSMSRDDAWKHVTTFLNSYIGGLEEVAREHRFKDEHVALATFGHETRVIQRFTNDMSKLRTALGNIKLGGPSPMYGGLAMAYYAAATPGDHAICMGRINKIPVPTKIVLITDGELTDSCLYQGPDEADINKLEETKKHLLSAMDYCQTKRTIDFFCMPVGNANMEFLQLMTGVADGKMISYIEGRQFARRSYLMTKTHLSKSGSGQSSSDPMGLFSQMSGQSSADEDMSLSTQDKEQIEDIKKDIKKGTKAFMDRMLNSWDVQSSQQHRMYLDPNSSKLPAVGTRVRRGPDLEEFHMQYCNGSGTVTGQYEGEMMLWVEWDADADTDVYRYGHGIYDLLIVDEPRNVTDGKLAVGCTVRPGKDFHYRDTKVKPQERGVAIQINQDTHTVRVKWGNKERGKYKYSDNRQGKMEVEMCSSSSPSKKQQQKTFVHERAPLKKSPNRNINKNT